MPRKVWRAISPYLVAIVGAVVVWTVLGWWSERIWTTSLMPDPASVARAGWEALTSGEFYFHLSVTMRRVLIGWIIALSIGVTVGIVMGRIPWVGALLAPWTIVGYAVPAAATILFMILLLGINERSTTIALIIAIAPFLVNIVFQGVRATDVRLFEMGRVFRLGRWQRLRHVLIPQVLPSVLTAARFGFATTWKIVLIVEVFASQDGIGQRLEFFYARLRPDRLLAWTLSFAAVMLILERVGYTTLERRIFRWRKSSDFLADRRSEAFVG